MLHKKSKAAYSLCGAVLLVLAGCDATGIATVGRSGPFQYNYEIARGALEAGKFRKAVKHYRALIGQSGPAGGRIRLEYAHALLRADNFSEAALVARQVAAEQTGLARVSALSVQATADQEIARAAMAKGQYDKAVYDHLVSARTAFDQVHETNPDMDRAFAARRAEAAAAEASVKSSLGI